MVVLVVEGGVVSREMLPTGSRALSALYINLCLVPPPPPLPAPSHCRKYQRHQLFFNLRLLPLDYVPFFHPERWDVRWKRTQLLSALTEVQWHIQGGVCVCVLSGCEAQEGFRAAFETLRGWV